MIVFNSEDPSNIKRWEFISTEIAEELNTKIVTWKIDDKTFFSLHHDPNKKIHEYKITNGEEIRWQK